MSTQAFRSRTSKSNYFFTRKADSESAKERRIKRKKKTSIQKRSGSYSSQSKEICKRKENRRQPVPERIKNQTMKYFNTIIDDSIPEWQEIGEQALFAGLAGMLIAIAIYLAVAL